MWAYPIRVEADDNGTLLVSFVDIPEAHTFAEQTDDINLRATDCLLTALEAYIKARRPIPPPSAKPTGRLVVLPPLAAAKVELYEAMRNAGMRKSELAHRLGWHMPQVDRLLSLRHGSRLEQVEAALAELGHRLEISVRVTRGANLRRNEPLPRRIEPATASAGRARRGATRAQHVRSARSRKARASRSAGRGR